eukprot:m.77555 g.77555  ORF g.77555 m.77555 type:complete len:1273 (+) comp12631_c0_seq4:267-4085(+)
MSGSRVPASVSSDGTGGNQVDIAGTDFVFILADHLKNRGDVMLSGEEEYSINTDWMTYLNKHFPQCDRADDFTPASFKFTRPEHEPLAFIFEFFQLIPRLKLIPGKRYYMMPDTVFDLNPFRSLQELRIIKVDAERIRGLQYLRSQIKRVQCRRSIPSLYYFFGACAGDEVTRNLPWSALEYLDCSGNSLPDMEYSLKMFTNLEVLNLSDNNIAEISTDIKFLRNLTELNLNYNRIESLRPLVQPDVSPALARLRVLSICNNKLSSLIGTECLSDLEELDLSHNDINSFDELRRIRHLTKLKRLWTDGNPISYQKHSRARILSFFPDWKTLVLDGQEPASLDEQILVEHYLLTGRADSPPMMAPTLALLDFDMQGRAASRSPTPEGGAAAQLPQWAKDDRCNTCGAVFTWALGSTPRHHCRLCGRSVCHKHSDHFEPLPEFGPEYTRPQRLCDSCFRTLHRAKSPIPTVTRQYADKGKAPYQDARQMTPRRRAKSVDIEEAPVKQKVSQKLSPDQSASSSVGNSAADETTPATPVKGSSTENHPAGPPLTPPAAISTELNDSKDDLNTSYAPSLPSTPGRTSSPATNKSTGKKPRSKRKSKKKKSPSKVLAEQEAFYAKVNEIFHTVGDKALAVLTEVLDDINQESEGLTNSRSSSPKKEKKATPPSEAESSEIETLNNRHEIGKDSSAFQRPFRMTSTPKKENPMRKHSPSYPGSKSSDDNNEDENIDDGLRTPTPTTPDVKVNENLWKNSGGEEVYLVEIFDRTNQKVKRFLEIQGDTSVVVSDLGGKTVDLWDLGRLVEAKELEASEDSIGVPMMQVAFFVDRRHRKNFRIQTESWDDLDQILSRLQSIVEQNTLEIDTDDVTQKYKCLKCDTVFAFEQDRFGGQELICPNCDSTYVVEFFVPMSLPSSAVPPMTPKNSSQISQSSKSSATPMPNETKLETSNKGITKPTSPEIDQNQKEFYTKINEWSPPFDCTQIAHDRKLLLELEYLQDGERFQCALDVHVSKNGEGEPAPGLIVASNKSLLIFVAELDDGLSLLGSHAWPQIKGVKVGFGRQFFSLTLDDFEYTLGSGDEEMTWSFLKNLSKTPELRNVPIKWVDLEGLKTLAGVLELQAPPSESLPPLLNGKMLDVEQVWEKRGILQTYEESWGLDLALLARLKQGDGAMHLLVLTSESILLLREDTQFKEGTSWILVDSQDLASVSGLVYSVKKPEEIGIETWTEDLDRTQDEVSRWDLIFRSERGVHTAVRVINDKWKPLFGGFDLPVEYTT